MDVLRNFVGSEILRLDRNESHFFSDSLRHRALQSLGESCFFSSYPDSSNLARLLADYHRVDVDDLILTNGAEEAIVRVLRMLAFRDGELIVPTPAFPPILQHAQSSGFVLRKVPWVFGEFPIDDILARLTRQTRAIFLATPNNPTGQCIPFDDIAELCQALPYGIVIVDNVYGAFSQQEDLSCYRKFSNCIVLRSLSKSWCIPGLRVGYAIAKKHFKKKLEFLGGAFPISSLSIRIAEFCLEHGRDSYQDHLLHIAEERKTLSELLTSCGIAVLPSHANFVFAKFPDAAFVHKGLVQCGIMVKEYFDSEMSDFLRIGLPGCDIAFQRLCRALMGILVTMKQGIHADSVFKSLNP